MTHPAPRHPRPLRRLAARTLLLAAILTAALYAVSTVAGTLYMWSLPSSTDTYYLGAGNGTLLLGRADVDPHPSGSSELSVWTIWDSRHRAHSWAMSWWFTPIRKPTQSGISIPIWSILLPLALAAWIAGRPPRPPKHGKCSSCGYDLNGLLAPVCPECGRPHSG